VKKTPKQFPDINILPTEYRERRLTPFRAVLLLLILVCLISGYNLVQARVAASSDLATLEKELQRLTLAADKLAPKLKEAQQMQKDIDALKERVEKVKEAQMMIQGQRLDWFSLLQPLLLSPPKGIELYSINYQGLNLKVNGGSHAGYEAIFQYSDQVKEAPSVSQVFIDRVELRETEKGKSFLSFGLTLKLKGG